LLFKHYKRITIYMSNARENRITKKRGRPKGAKGALPAMAVIAIRLPTDLVDLIDEWGAERGMTRSASLRRWIENGVNERWKPLQQQPALRAQTRAQAAAMAAETIDRHTDQSAAPEEQASRKRRLLKGPKEFREIRKDHK
jgi:hypothetical protein